MVTETPTGAPKGAAPEQSAYWSAQNLFDPAIFSRPITEDELTVNKGWLQASAIVHQLAPDAILKRSHGISDQMMEAARKGDFSQFAVDQVRALGEYGIDHMSWFNYNLASTGINTSKVKSGTDLQKHAFMFMMDAYEHKDQTADGWGRALRGAVLDPTNLVGAGLIVKGAQFAGNNVVKTAIREAIKSSLKTGLAVGAADGVLSATADDQLRQSVYISSGRQDGVNWKRAGITTLIGTVAGGVLGAGVPIVTRWSNKIGERLGLSGRFGNASETGGAAASVTATAATTAAAAVLAQPLQTDIARATLRETQRAASHSRDALKPNGQVNANQQDDGRKDDNAGNGQRLKDLFYSEAVYKTGLEYLNCDDNQSAEKAGGFITAFRTACQVQGMLPGTEDDFKKAAVEMLGRIADTQGTAFSALRQTTIRNLMDLQPG